MQLYTVTPRSERVRADYDLVPLLALAMSEKPTARVAIRPAGNASPQQLDAQAKCARSSTSQRPDALQVGSAQARRLHHRHLRAADRDLLRLARALLGPSVAPLLCAHADARAAKNTTPAAISAAVMVNVVLVAYIIVAFLEDQPAAAPKTKAQ